MLFEKIVEACTPWYVDKTYRLYDLIIKEGGQLIPPEGKFLTLTVDGCGRAIEPGTYRGDVVVSVTDHYDLVPLGLMKVNGKHTALKQGAVITDNKVIESQCVPAILQDAKIGDRETDGLYVASSEEDFNAIVIDGSSEYTIKNSVFNLEGMAHNDWLGLGTAVMALDNAKVVLENCKFQFAGVTRPILQVAGHSQVLVKDCRLVNISPADEDWVGSFSWAIGFRGYNRLTQLCDSAKVRYEGCTMIGNGWGLCSIDGSDEPVEMYLKDCDMSLSGPRNHGYGAFCIGDNHIVYDHCRVDVFGYPVLLMGMEGVGRYDIINGSEITGRRFGALVIDDDNSVLNIADSTFRTGKSSICIKGSSTIIEVKNSQLIPGNGTILQLMDCDEAGMNVSNFKVPVGVVDTKDESRDLTVVSPTEDVTINLTDCVLEGNIFNSTTNIRAYRLGTIGGMGKLCDYVLGMSLNPDPDRPLEVGVQLRHDGDDLKGAKNLGVNLKNTHITGLITAASQAYREGLTYITNENQDELSNVTQAAAAPINNGVVITLDSASRWTVTGPCWATSLTIADGAVLEAADGKALKMLVDGTETSIASGVYTGMIELVPEE